MSALPNAVAQAAAVTDCTRVRLFVQLLLVHSVVIKVPNSL